MITGGDDSGTGCAPGRPWAPGFGGLLCLLQVSQQWPGVLKAVTLAGSWRVLAVTDTGALYLYDSSRSSAGRPSWRTCALFSPTASWRQPLVPRGFGLCALANGEGRVKVVPINTPTAAVDLTLFPGKVHSLSWALRGYEELLLLASGPAAWWLAWRSLQRLLARPSSLKESKPLPPASKQAEVAHVQCLPPPGDFLVCGDRRLRVALPLPTRAA